MLCTRNIAANFKLIMLVSTFASLTGCTSFLAPIEGVPSYRIPDSFLARPTANYAELGLARLSQKPADEYRLDSGDILGIYIEGILPPAGDEEEIAPPPPVNLPSEGSDLPPSVGYPIPVRDDGTLSLPLVDPLDVEGKTLSEAERLVRQAYTKDRRILREGQDRIIVTLLEERTVRVIVVREDAESGESSLKLKNGQLVSDSNRQGTGHVLDLPAYKNDLMHALAQTGGLPSLKAKNEVKILRRGNSNPAQRDAFVQAFYAQYDCNFCMTPPPLPDDPSTVRIPLRYPPNEIPRFNPDDVILRDGDIVYIEARDTEFFYTGGLLPGGQFPIPRDYDLDILGAMAISGQGLAGRSGNVGGGNASAILGGGFGGAVPTQLYIFRKLANGKEVTISVDLVNAMNDPGQRLLVQAGDTLILRYKPCEEVLNFTLIGLFTFGIRELLN